MASNEDIVKKLDNLEQEIYKSRQKNSDEHNEILRTAKDINMLSSQIQEVLDNFKGFSNTLRFARNMLITFGALWLIFKEPILSTFGG